VARQEVRVNWAFQKEQHEDTSAHFHIFVGDISNAVSGCSDARVMWDHATGR
jgi:nucleolysin TIA-1/TIAR